MDKSSQPLPHMLVAFGYGVTKKRNGNVKDKYFAVTDNGATTGLSYKPYMRKKKFLGFTLWLNA